MSCGRDVRTSVAIIGGGPVGLALAGDLGARGVSCVLVEQRDASTDHPRANAQNSRTMEFFRRWGISEAVKQSSTPPDFPHTALYLTSLRGYELARFERPSHGGLGLSPISPERPQRCNQLRLDPILRSFAAAQPSVDVRYLTKFISFTQDADGVLARVQDLATGEEYTVAADYLVACCGGQSGVRRTIGAVLQGEPELDYSLNVFLKIPSLWERHDKGKASLHFIVGPQGHWAVLAELDGHSLWRLTLTGREYYDKAESVGVDAIVKKVIGDGVPYEVISYRTWVARGLVATSYSRGRVFLAGDAAHQNPPNGGFGLNTGMGDAVDLGWKLAACIQGWGGERLLASYEQERRPVALRNVQEAVASLKADQSIGKHPDIEEASESGERHRAEVSRQVQALKQRMLISDGIALGYTYAGSPIIANDDDPDVEQDVMRYVPNAKPGSRAPHAWLSAGCSILDLFGHAFVLLIFGSDELDVNPMVGAFQMRKAPLSTVVISDTEARSLYGRKLVLVRPDGHVAWRSDAPPQDPLALVDQVTGASPA